MSDLHDLTNSPIKLTLGGTFLLFRRLSIQELFTHFQSEVKSEYMATVKEYSGMLNGTDKVEFLKYAMGDMPRGDALMQAAQARMSSVEGVGHMIWLAARKCTPELAKEKVQELLMAASEEEIKLITEYIVGKIEEKVEKPIQEGTPTASPPPVAPPLAP